MSLSCTGSSSEEKTSIQNEESSRSVTSKENKDLTHAGYDQNWSQLQVAQRSQHKTTTVSTDMSDSLLSGQIFSSNTVRVNIPEHVQPREVEVLKYERKEKPGSKRDDLDWADISKKLAQPEHGELPGCPILSLNSEMSKMYPGSVYAQNFDNFSVGHNEFLTGFYAGV